MKMKTPARNVTTAGRLRGAEIYNPAGEVLGVFEDLCLDLETGHIPYFVMTTRHADAARGLRHYVLPWHLLIDRDQVLTVDLDPERLKDASDLEPWQLPDAPIDNWRQEVFEYGARRGRSDSPSMSVTATGSTPRGRTRMGREIAQMVVECTLAPCCRLDEVAVDLTVGHVACARLTHQRAVAAVPWQVFEFDVDRGLLVCVSSPSTLVSAPDFDPGMLSRLAWLADLHSHFGIDPYWQVRDPVSARR